MVVGVVSLSIISVQTRPRHRIVTRRNSFSIAMEFNIPLLQSLDDEPVFRVEKGIDADFQSLFYVPKLVDEPQNPIFDALQPISKGSRKRRNKPHQQDLPNLQLQKPPCPTPGVQSSVPADFWFAAAQNLDTEVCFIIPSVPEPK